MPAVRRQIAIPQRNLRNGILLAVTQAANLVNIPVAQDVVHHIRKMATALKAPKDNDTTARELAECVIQLADGLNRAFEYMDSVGFLEADDSEEVLEHTIELQALRDHLVQVHSELRAIQARDYSSKLASQAHIRDCLLEVKEDLWNTNMRITACTDAIMMHYHYTAARAQRERRDAMSEQIRVLALQVNAMQATRQSDEQKLTNLVLMNHLYAVITTPGLKPPIAKSAWHKAGS